MTVPELSMEQHGGPSVLCTNVVLTTLEPAEKTAHVETIDPTATDMLTTDSYLPTFMAYRLVDSSDAVYEQVVKRLKDSLRNVLVPFFPWAGRWVAIPSGRGRQLQCNDKGVPFIEACVDQTLDSVIRISAGFQPVPELQGYGVLGLDDMNFKQPMLPDGLPCVFVQVTRFKCGGLAMAITYNHMTGDGKSLFDFMQAWADFSRISRTDMVLDHNRAAIDALAPASLPTDTFSNPPPAHRWGVKCYEVSTTVIDSLKKEVRESADGAYVSTMDCIFAHFWKTLSSLPFSIIGGKEVGMLSSVDGRNKFYDPKVPNLLGNVLVNIRGPTIPPEDLLKMPVSVIASHIRDKLISTSNEEWLSPERLAESLDVFLNENILPWGQTCCTSFPMYKIDFGFGKSIFTPGFNTNFSWDMLGMSYVGPPTPGVSSSSAFVAVRSSPQLLEALESHPEFPSLFLQPQ